MFFCSFDKSAVLDKKEPNMALFKQNYHGNYGTGAIFIHKMTLAHPRAEQ